MAQQVITRIFSPHVIGWGFVGARTSASQTHREVASSLPFSIGFKNSTDGNIQQAIQAMTAASSPHRFPCLNGNGELIALESPGNPWTHVVLRGASVGPNYDPFTVAATAKQLKESNFNRRILVDCSHGNCQRQADLQKAVFASLLDQFLQGSPHLLGMMLESHLEEGAQTLSESPTTLQYGISVTDPCLGWHDTEHLIRDAFRQVSLI